MTRQHQQKIREFSKTKFLQKEEFDFVSDNEDHEIYYEEDDEFHEVNLSQKQSEKFERRKVLEIQLQNLVSKMEECGL